MSENPLRLLIADDHLIVREGLKLIFETEPRFKIVGEADNGKAALELIERLNPDLVLTDLYMPGMSGLELLKVLQEKKSLVPVVVLTTFKEDRLVADALSLGAKGYLLKDATRQDLIGTLESAIRGTVRLHPEIAGKMSGSKAASFQALTERELQILKEVARGCPSKVIACDAGISERTVKAHLTHIYQKLGVDSRAGAVAVALDRGLIRMGK